MSTGSLDIINTVAAGLAIVLSTISLVWQTITWRLSGGIARADLFLGATDHTGKSYVTLPAKSTLAEVDMLAREEFPQKLIVVTVRNVGRLPITVQGWTVQLAKKYRSSQFTFAIGPELPFRIDVGESTTWGVEIERLASIVKMLHDSKNSKRIKIQAEVELGDSRTILTRQKIWL